MAEDILDLFMIDRVREVYLLHLLDITDELLGQLNVLSGIISHIDRIIDDDERKDAGNGKKWEVNPSCRPIASASAVTVELCELGKPPQEMT